MKTESDLEWFEFPDGYKAGSIFIGDEADPIYINYSFPNKLNDCYLCISDGSHKDLASQMASLQQYNENEAHLCHNHTVPTDDKYLNENGWYSYLITTPQISYSKFPENTEIQGRNIVFRLALPLSKNEKSIKIDQGINALMDYFQKIERDTISFV